MAGDLGIDIKELDEPSDSSFLVREISLANDFQQVCNVVVRNGEWMRWASDFLGTAGLFDVRGGCTVPGLVSAVCRSTQSQRGRKQERPRVGLQAKRQRRMIRKMCVAFCRCSISVSLLLSALPCLRSGCTSTFYADVTSPDVGSL